MCSVARVETIFQPCGHAVACQSCSSRMKKCPECRTVISEKIPVQNWNSVRKDFLKGIMFV